MGDLLHNGADSGDLAGADWDEDKMWASLLISPASLQTPTVSGKNAFLLKHQSIKDSKLITQFFYLFIF